MIEMDHRGDIEFTVGDKVYTDTLNHLKEQIREYVQKRHDISHKLLEEDLDDFTLSCGCVWDLFDIQDGKINQYGIELIDFIMSISLTMLMNKRGKRRCI